MLMLILRKKILQKHYYYLNTSNVNVNPKTGAAEEEFDSYLNTSNVNVNRIHVVSLHKLQL